MSLAIKFANTQVGQQFFDAFASKTGVREQMSYAATEAAKEGGELLKTEVRKHIAQAGFSKRWQNAWRVKVYPERGHSLEPAIFGWHNIGYSTIFENGGTITGKSGLLWIPLPTTPKTGKGRPRARDFKARGINLVSFKSRKGTPLLGALQKSTDKTRSANTVRLSSLVVGARPKKRRKGQTFKTVPLFYGIRSVTIRPRFRVAAVADKVRAALEGLYDKWIGANR